MKMDRYGDKVGFLGVLDQVRGSQMRAKGRGWFETLFILSALIVEQSPGRILASPESF